MILAHRLPFLPLAGRGSHFGNLSRKRIPLFLKNRNTRRPSSLLIGGEDTADESLSRLDSSLARRAIRIRLVTIHHQSSITQRFIIHRTLRSLIHHPSDTPFIIHRTLCSSFFGLSFFDSSFIGHFVDQVHWGLGSVRLLTHLK